MLLRALQAAIRIEAAGRRAIAVRRLAEARAACARIQSSVRGRIARRAYERRCGDHRSLIAEISRLRAERHQQSQVWTLDFQRLQQQNMEIATLSSGLAGCLIPGTVVRIQDEVTTCIHDTRVEYSRRHPRPTTVALHKFTCRIPAFRHRPSRHTMNRATVGLIL